MTTRFLSTLATIALCGVAMVHAQAPRAINYQGYLTSPNGAAISASMPMVFRIYGVASGGAALHTEPQTVAVTNGIFNVLLGTAAALTLPFDAQYYLGVTVGADAELSPRQPLAASPYSIRAASAEALATTAVVPGLQISDASVTAAKLASNGCTVGQVMQFNGSVWICSSPAASSGGTVTSITAGSGLTGGSITSSGTLAADTTFLQRRIASSCPAGSSIRAIAADGSVTCQTDAIGTGTVTSIATGAGLTGGPITGSGTIGLASGLTLLGTTTGTFSGSLTGNVTGSATSFTGALGGDVVGTQSASAVAQVGGVSATSVATGTNLANAATSANTPNTLVKRDGSGNFSGATIQSTSGGVKFPDGTTQTTAWATPFCFDAVNRFKDCGDGTVMDQKTGLMWEKKILSTDARCTGATPDVHCQNKRYTWTASVSPYTDPNGTLYTDFLDTLNDLKTPNDGTTTTCFAGYCDWRIPTINELRSILVAPKPNCPFGACFEPTLGPYPTGDLTWSSNTAYTASIAWTMYFSTGSVDNNVAKFNLATGRAVRNAR